MKTFWNKDKDFRVFVWTIFNAIIAFVGTYLSGLTGPEAIVIAAIAVPFLNAFTKYVNVRWFNDLGVTKEI